MSDRIRVKTEGHAHATSLMEVSDEVDEQEQEDEILEEDDDEPEQNSSLTEEDRMVILLSNSNSLDESYNNGDYDEREQSNSSGMIESVSRILKPLRSSSGRANKFWTPPIEQAFLDKIKTFSCLYDHRDENWKNKKHKEGIWALIGSEVGIPATECRRHFKHMRDKFVRNKRTGKTQNNRFTRGMSFLVDLDLIKHRPKPMDDIQFLGTMSTSNSRNGSGRSTPILESHKTYASILPKRHYLDAGEDDDDCEEDGYVLADTVMEPAPNPMSSITITRSNNNTPIPRRNMVNPAISRSLATFMSMSGKDPLGNIAYHMNGMPTLTTSATHLTMPSNGFTVPRTINQTTITPAMPTAHYKPTNPTTNGSTNGNSNGSSGGPNYFFGQYIASVLDSLPQSDSLLTRHKLQEILFEAQSRLSTPQKQLIDFKCANCCNIYQGSAQLP